MGQGGGIQGAHTGWGGYGGGESKGQGEKGGKRTGDGGVRVSGTDYPWEAIDLPRESDTPTCKQTPGESSPLLTSFVFFLKKSSHLSKTPRLSQTVTSNACFSRRVL